MFVYYSSHSWKIKTPGAMVRRKISISSLLFCIVRYFQIIVFFFSRSLCTASRILSLLELDWMKGLARNFFFSLCVHGTKMQCTVIWRVWNFTRGTTEMCIMLITSCQVKVFHCCCISWGEASCAYMHRKWWEKKWIILCVCSVYFCCC